MSRAVPQEPTSLAGDFDPEQAMALFGDRAAGALRYAEILATTGVERGLLGPSEGPRVWTRHIVNCSVVEQLVPAGGRAHIVDLGSGAGLPGLPIALARPDVEMELVEPLERRAAFLAECLGELKLTQVSLRRARAEDLRGYGADVVVARAVAPLGRLAALAMPILRPGGMLLALKGRNAEQEMLAGRAEVGHAGGTGSRVETCGEGVLDPPTRVVVIERGAWSRAFPG